MFNRILNNCFILRVKRTRYGKKCVYLNIYLLDTIATWDDYLYANNKKKQLFVVETPGLNDDGIKGNNKY